MVTVFTLAWLLQLQLGARGIEDSIKTLGRRESVVYVRIPSEQLSGVACQLVQNDLVILYPGSHCN